MSTPGARVNEVRLGLLAALAALEDGNTSVVDSAIAGRTVKPRVVVVGTQVGTQKTDPQALGAGYGQRIQIACTVMAASGSKDPAGRWDEGAALLDQVETLIRADPTLGGACFHSVLGPELIWTPTSDQEGSLLTVDFSVVAQKDG